MFTKSTSKLDDYWEMAKTLISVFFNGDKEKVELKNAHQLTVSKIRAKALLSFMKNNKER